MIEEQTISQNSDMIFVILKSDDFLCEFCVIFSLIFVRFRDFVILVIFMTLYDDVQTKVSDLSLGLDLITILHDHNNHSHHNDHQLSLFYLQ